MAKFFSDAQGVVITGGTFADNSVTIHQGGQTTTHNALKELSAHAAHTALHNSAARFDAPSCHRNTRASYLDGLEHWILGDADNHAGARLIWLTGGAGAGKSAIMQSIVERTAHLYVVLGTFFFSRADSSRNYAEVLIPTLAYQLACAFPAAMVVLEPIINGNPLIFKSSLQTQAHELLVRPLLHLVTSGIIDATSAVRMIFVIDGLDECEDPKKQALIIHVISTILCDNHIPVSFLVASRPEVAISQAFQRESRAQPILDTISLDANDEVESDIRQFIEDSFIDIRSTHPLRAHIPADWPTRDSVRRLVRRSSGHFIYAATAMKFLISSDEHPARALRVIEGLEASRTGSPFAELDALYRHIIVSARYGTEVQEILKHCHYRDFNDTVAAFCAMHPVYSPEDVALYLSDMHALISLLPDNKAGLCIFLKHASLSDFLGDEDRSGQLYVNSAEYNVSLLPCYFGMLDLDCRVAISRLTCAYEDVIDLGHSWGNAIRHCRDEQLLHSLINSHSPREVWILSSQCPRPYLDGLEVSGLDTGGEWWQDPGIYVVSRYLAGIRDSVANHDNALYKHQFGMFIQALVDDMSATAPKSKRILALLFSSIPSHHAKGEMLMFPTFLIQEFKTLGFCFSWFYFFDDLILLPAPPRGHIVLPQSMDVLWHLPQRHLSWGADLASVLKVILPELLNYLWVPECIVVNRHKQWLRRSKPWKHGSLGNPRLACAFNTRLRRLPVPGIGYNTPRASLRIRRAGYTSYAAVDIAGRRGRCYLILKAVTYYLHKCDCTSELVSLARKPLPMAALWFPHLMRKARKAMDAYVCRWEESPEGLLEKTRSLSVNDMD